jgi:radical SAM protein with 4Fe4S-binding SPASM domain
MIKHKETFAEGDKGVLLKGYSYSAQEFKRARDANELICLRMETNYNCNLRCRYCYSYDRREGLDIQMSIEAARDVIDQGVKLGLRSIVYLGGGEPLVYNHFWPFMDYVSSQGVIPVVFTNGILTDQKTADRMFGLGASLMTKLDALNEDVQNKLTGPETYQKIIAGLNTLLRAGFARKDGRYTRLGIGACATKINLNEIPKIWRFARDNNIFPNVELATEIGMATSDITLTMDEAYHLRKTLRKIDYEEYGNNWNMPHSSIAAHSCGIFLCGAAVTADGGVSLCPEMPAVANLAEKPLSKIIAEPPFSEARTIERHIEEPCKSCDSLETCLGGCRSKAVVQSKSMWACDPYCSILIESETNRKG